MFFNGCNLWLAVVDSRSKEREYFLVDFCHLIGKIKGGGAAPPLDTCMAEILVGDLACRQYIMCYTDIRQFAIISY